MKKRFLSLITALAITASFIIIPTAASAAASGTCGRNLTWVLENGVLTISGTGDMEYTATSTYEESSQWREYMTEITEVVIEQGVTSISEWAFYNCTNLTNVYIPDSVTDIGHLAFYGCTALTSITLPRSVASIDSDFIYSSGAVSSATLAALIVSLLSTGSISGGTFSGCGNLLINVDENNPYYSSVDGVLFNKDQTELVAYAKDNIVSQYSIPEGVTSIGDKAFYECTNLTNVTIPDSVTSIGDGAFNGCSGLTTIKIPKSVTSIGDNVFGSSGLTDVYYGGTEASWTDLNNNTTNTALTSAAIYYNTVSVIQVLINGTKLSADRQPVMINDRILVPLRAIFEALGYTVNWDESTQTATAVKDSDSITVQIDNNIISYVTDGQAGEYICDVAPQKIFDRTYVPTRAIAECAGCTVTWEESTQTVYITK